VSITSLYRVSCRQHRRFAPRLSVATDPTVIVQRRKQSCRRSDSDTDSVAVVELFILGQRRGESCSLCSHTCHTVKPSWGVFYRNLGALSIDHRVMARVQDHACTPFPDGRHNLSIEPCGSGLPSSTNCVCVSTTHFPSSDFSRILLELQGFSLLRSSMGDCDEMSCPAFGSPTADGSSPEILPCRACNESRVHEFNTSWDDAQNGSIAEKQGLLRPCDRFHVIMPVP
jgi:hypothetical protein